MLHNGLRVGDVALCCACGKAILLTRCYGLLISLFYKSYRKKNIFGFTFNFDTAIINIKKIRFILVKFIYTPPKCHYGTIIIVQNLITKLSE